MTAGQRFLLALAAAVAMGAAVAAASLALDAPRVWPGTLLGSALSFSQTLLVTHPRRRT